MKNKVSELRNILNQKKATEKKMKESKKTHDNAEEFNPEETLSEKAPDLDHSEDDASSETETNDDGDIAALKESITALENKIEEMGQANATQKDMFMRQAAEFENSKKRLEKEQEELSKFASEKIITELLPIIDSLEMTLSHTTEDDPVASGVALILKQFIQTLEKVGVTIISGEGDSFDPNIQEAIATEESEELESGVVVKVNRTGYSLHGKVIRAALVTVSK